MDLDLPGPALPVDEVLPELVEVLGQRPAAVLHAPTGAGKTTRVPLALLKAPWLDGLVVMLEPRRVAARAAARRLAQLHGDAVGETIGYQVRHERVGGRHTRVWVVTEGVLLRWLQRDPLLEDVAVVVFDEHHERSLQADLAFAMLRHLRRELRDDLRLLPMSATLDVDRTAAALDAAVVRSEGRTFPVDIRYLPRPDDRRIEDQAADAALHLLDEVDGDVLVFLPGAGEIRRTAAALSPRLPPGTEAIPLHGRLPPREQDRALTPGRLRRVVLSTNVAETSVTLPRIAAVVDTGLARVMQHDTGRGLGRLELAPISRASADQRAGRAGRLGPGLALRLWTARSHAARPEHDVPEIERADLSDAVLSLYAWGEPDPYALPWLTEPPLHAVRAAERQLVLWGALRDGVLTDVGEAMARLPADPRLARFLVAAHRLGVSDDAALLAAWLGDGGRARRDPPSWDAPSDLDEILDALKGGSSHGWRLARGAVHTARRGAKQLRGALRRALGPTQAPTHRDALSRALLAAWPERLARRRTAHGERLQLATGRGAVLHRTSAVRSAPWLVAVDVLDTGDTDARVYLAAAADPAWLDLQPTVEVAYHPDRDRVVGRRVTRHGALELEVQEGVPAEASEVEAALVAAAAEHPDRALPDDRDTTELIDRLRFLHRVRPDLGVGPHDTGDLLGVAPQLARGCRSLADLSRRDWRGALLGRLPWQARAALDDLAPERLQVPSGSRIRLAYPDDGPPVLAVRIQELYGLDRTPTVGGVPVLLQLLAPNQRPQQVTDDLPGFWDRTYPEVRKELRQRYPKWSWPEDPRTARPERRPQRRRR